MKKFTKQGKQLARRLDRAYHNGWKAGFDEGKLCGDHEGVSEETGE